ncbi:hypothetical protein KKG45_11855 [bacterium]|nr:hypothetical protein [bacterium]MBU1073931.1 hypothetical protein [bacterium]MBU1676724.1 hypothetical protein [bacterium]
MPIPRLSFLMLVFALAAAPALADRIPPPIFDFCDLAVAVVADEQGHAAYAGDTCDGGNLVPDHDCGATVNYYGQEDYYAVAMDPGCTFTATVAHAGDVALMVTAECIVYGTLFTCLAGVDETGPGGVETIAYTNDSGAATTVYLVLDSLDTERCGAYTLSLQTDCTVGAKKMSLGGVKAGYE